MYFYILFVIIILILFFKFNISKFDAMGFDRKLRL